MYLNHYNIEEQVKSPIAIEFINAELKKLNDFEEKVNALIREKTINYSDKNIKPEFVKETELMRVQSGYYKKNALHFVNAIGHNAVVCYAEHILLKNYLENHKASLQNPFITGYSPFDKIYEFAKVNTDALRNYLESKPNEYSHRLTKELIWLDFKKYLAEKFNLNENSILWDYVTKENFLEFLPLYFEKVKEEKGKAEFKKIENKNSWQIDKSNIEELKSTNLSISKLDFTKEKLRTVILELSKLNGYDKPSTFLDELLVKVKTLNDYEFTCNFFLNIHHLCKEHQNEFWSEGHKKDISKWLNKARFNPTFSTPEKDIPLFSTTWEIEKPNNQTHIEQINETPISNKKTTKPEKSLSDYIFNINDIEVFLNELKNTFNTEKGQDIKVVINELKANNLLVINSRGFKNFYKVLEDYFKRDIGSYQSINDVKEIHNDIKKPILEKLNPLILKYKQSI